MLSLSNGLMYSSPNSDEGWFRIQYQLDQGTQVTGWRIDNLTGAGNDYYTKAQGDVITITTKMTLVGTFTNDNAVSMKTSWTQGSCGAGSTNCNMNNSPFAQETEVSATETYTVGSAQLTNYNTGAPGLTWYFDTSSSTSDIPDALDKVFLKDYTVQVADGSGTVKLLYTIPLNDDGGSWQTTVPYISSVNYYTWPDFGADVGGNNGVISGVKIKGATQTSGAVMLTFNEENPYAN